MGKTSRETWKRFERTVAKFFGAKRNPLSGINSGHTGSDTRHGELYIECKLRKRFAFWSWFKEVEQSAEEEGKIPIMAFKEKGKKGWLLLVRPEHLKEIGPWVKQIEDDETEDER